MFAHIEMLLTVILTNLFSPSFLPPFGLLFGTVVIAGVQRHLSRTSARCVKAFKGILSSTKSPGAAEVSPTSHLWRKRRSQPVGLT